MSPVRNSPPIGPFGARSRAGAISNGVRIAIIDYNAGNIASVANALERLGFEYVITRDAETILAADKVIFPGQGRAAPAMKDLRESGLDDVIRKIEKPFLGICLGMQLLFEFSEEDNTKCLGILGGTVRKFKGSVKVPQIGWNTVTQTTYDPLFCGIPDTMYAYFVNSFYAADSPAVIARSTYGAASCAAIVKKNNFYGTQFHPEKSGALGVQLLKNFCELGAVQKQNVHIFPAIDIIGGTCVRLTQGDYGKQTTYDDDPVAVARSFVNAGAQYVHVVDLEGAKVGKPVNTETVLKIVREIPVPVQVGGGIRTLEQAAQYLDAGVERVIIGTSALSNPGMVQTLVNTYGPGRVAVSVDAKNGRVARSGWLELSAETVGSVLKGLTTLGVTTIIYTDITRDGTLSGPNFEAIARVIKEPFKVIVAGGISSQKDLDKLRRMGAYGTIVGKALYEKKIDATAFHDQKPIPRSTTPVSNVTKRVIACMDIADGRVVKGTHFKDLRDAGDPVELAKRYSDDGVDELVFLDINATVENRATLYELVSRIAKNINIPFTVGGGVRTVQDIKNLLNAGADKVSIGSAAVTNPELVSDAAREFGSQCIVISVDPKTRGDTWEIFIKGGREATSVNAIEFCKDMTARGAGELLVNSLDKDGTKEGYDLDLLSHIAESVRVPVIASSGAGTKAHFLEALTKGKADASLAASLFHRGEIPIPELKEYLSQNDISVRI
jgi:cyclase